MIFALLLAMASPADWVPARWNWTDPATLDLLTGTPINCLLVKTPDAAFAAKALEKGITTLAVATAETDADAVARGAVEAKVQGVVLEGDFDQTAVGQVRKLMAGAGIVIELPSRTRLRFDSSVPINGTWQGVWPGIHVLEGGAAKAAPTGSPWIDTNAGFLRAARARTGATLWLGNLPPPKTVLSAERYLHAICDAAIAGGRWVVALDDDLAARLKQGEPVAVKTWKRMAAHLEFFEKHREWRGFQPHGRLAVVQDLRSGALLSGSILDMIGARHTPIRAVPREDLSAQALAGSTMAVSVDPETLDPQQQEILVQFRRSGGTVLTPPPGSHIRPPADAKRITLEDNQVERLTEIWRDVQSMIGRRNLGVRLFNVAGMLSSLLAGPGGKPVIIQLVNYTSYPVENVTVHLLGNFERARLITPEGGERSLELYKTEDGTGIDIDRVSVSAAIRID
jgi:hypothetical protein